MVDMMYVVYDPKSPPDKTFAVLSVGEDEDTVFYAWADGTIGVERKTTLAHELVELVGFGYTVFISHVQYRQEVATQIAGTICVAVFFVALRFLEARLDKSLVGAIGTLGFSILLAAIAGLAALIRYYPKE